MLLCRYTQKKLENFDCIEQYLPNYNYVNTIYSSQLFESTYTTITKDPVLVTKQSLTITVLDCVQL